MEKSLSEMAVNMRDLGQHLDRLESSTIVTVVHAYQGAYYALHRLRRRPLTLRILAEVLTRRHKSRTRYELE